MQCDIYTDRCGSEKEMVALFRRLSRRSHTVPQHTVIMCRGPSVPVGHHTRNPPRRPSPPAAPPPSLARRTQRASPGRIVPLRALAASPSPSPIHIKPSVSPTSSRCRARTHELGSRNEKARRQRLLVLVVNALVSNTGRGTSFILTPILTHSPTRTLTRLPAAGLSEQTLEQREKMCSAAPRHTAYFTHSDAGSQPHIARSA
jgi:hypothetical protein